MAEPQVDVDVGPVCAATKATPHQRAHFGSGSPLKRVHTTIVDPLARVARPSPQRRTIVDFTMSK